jgi:hypothetical protein
LSGIAAHTRVRHRYGALFAVPVIVSLLLTACGSRGVDAGGFTASDRKAAQSGLDTLQSTSVSTMIVQLSATNQIPAVCLVHLESRDPQTFRVFIAWEPRGNFKQADTGNNYSWLTILLSSSGLKGNNWHLDNSPTKGALVAAYGDATTKPVDRCEILAAGGVRVLRTDSVPKI